MESEESDDFKAAHSTHYDFICNFIFLKIRGIEGFTALIFILGVGEMAYKSQPFNRPGILLKVWLNLTEHSSEVGSLAD